MVLLLLGGRGVLWSNGSGLGDGPADLSRGEKNHSKCLLRALAFIPEHAKSVRKAVAFPGCHYCTCISMGKWICFFFWKSRRACARTRLLGLWRATAPLCRPEAALFSFSSSCINPGRCLFFFSPCFSFINIIFFLKGGKTDSPALLFDSG